MVQKKIKKSHRYSTNVRVNIAKKSMSFVFFYVAWLVSPQKIKRFLIRRFFIPKKYVMSDEEKEYLGRGESLELSINNQKVRCWRWGSGPLIIFVHGWNGRGIQFHSFLDRFVSSGYSVAVFDGPGHGESEGETSSYFQMTDAVRAMFSFYGTDNVYAVVGHSLGASAIINTFSKENLHIPAVLIAPVLRLKEILETAFQRHGIPLNIYSTIIAEYEHEYKYDFKRDNPVNLLSALNTKALIIHDSEDQVIPVSESEEVARQYDFIDLYKTDGLGHKKILKDHTVITRALKYLAGFLPGNAFVQPGDR